MGLLIYIVKIHGNPWESGPVLSIVTKEAYFFVNTEGKNN